jgi:hypothetical protein
VLGLDRVASDGAGVVGPGGADAGEDG